LKLDDVQAACDFLRGDEVAGAGTGAAFTGLLPGRLGVDVAFPERPGAALARPHRVDGAAGGPVVGHAVGVELFAQGAAAGGQAGGPPRRPRRGTPRWRRVRPRPPRRSRARRCSSGHTAYSEIVDRRDTRVYS